MSVEDDLIALIRYICGPPRLAGSTSGQMFRAAKRRPLVSRSKLAFPFTFLSSRPDVRRLQRDKTACDELYLSLDTLPIRSTNDILLFHTCFHIKDLVYILRELVTQLSILIKRKIGDLDPEFFGFRYSTSRDVMRFSERNLASVLN
jgi:hypothetical protein